MNTYLPEAMQVHTPPATLDSLQSAIQTGAILSAAALRCDSDQTIHVQLGGIHGIIPRAEAAIGIREGTTRDIAILSLVGSTVCFKVRSLETGTNGQPVAVLSRRAAQEEAVGYFMTQARPGDILPAVVTHLEPFGAFCDIGCGFVALLGLEHISVSRIRHSRDRFTEGQQICCIIRQIDTRQRRVSLSHKELLGTWQENAAVFQAGQTVTGIVRDVKPYGAFIELSPNLSGLAEPKEPLETGDGVSVFIRSILPEKQKIKLSVIKKLPAGAVPRPEIVYAVTNGHLDRWQYGQGEKAGPVTQFT